jgi:hypothetical protein
MIAALVLTNIADAIPHWKGLIIETTSLITLLVACAMIVIIEVYGLRHILRALRRNDTDPPRP